MRKLRRPDPISAWCCCEQLQANRTGRFAERIAGCWSHIQGQLFPWLQAEIGPLTDNHKRLIAMLEVAGIEAHVRMRDGGPGRPLDDWHALARAFVAKAVLNVPTTAALIERLHVDLVLRLLVGWERAAQVPSEATFSRAFAELAAGSVPERVHAVLVERMLDDHLVGHIARVSASAKLGSRLN